MPIDGGKSSFTGWDNISMKMMEHDDLDKFMTILNKNRPSVLQVMKEEIADDETNFFIVENRKLREYLQRCTTWIYNNPPLVCDDMNKLQMAEDIQTYNDLVQDGLEFLK